MDLYTKEEFNNVLFDMENMINLGFIRESSLAIASPILAKFGFVKCLYY